MTKRGILASVLLVVMASTFASAQSVGPVARVDAPSQALEVDPNGTTTQEIIIANDGNLDADVDLRVVLESAAGWVATLEDVPATLAAGSEATILLRLEAPAYDPLATPALFNIDLSLADSATGQFASAASSAVQASLIPPPVVIPPEPTPIWPFVVAGVAVLALAGVAVVLLRRERALTVHSDQRVVQVARGEQAYVPLHAANRSNKPIAAEVSVQNAPTGWTIGTDVSHLVLLPNSEETFWLAAKRSGDGDESGLVRVQVKNPRAFGKHVLDLDVFSVARVPVAHAA